MKKDLILTHKSNTGFLSKFPKTFTRALVGCTVLAFSALAAKASVVTFGLAQNITAETDVLTSGTFDRAYSFQAPGFGDLTLNGVTFTSVSTPVSPGVASITVGNTIIASTTTFASLANSINSMTGDYNTLTLNAFYTDGSGGQLSLTLGGLINGQDYRVQLWVSYRGINGLDFKTETITSGGLPVSLNSNNGVTGAGQFVVGTFTADSIPQVFNISSGDNYPVLNAVSVYAVPEPSTYAMLILVGTFGLVTVYRRRQSKT